MTSSVLVGLRIWWPLLQHSDSEGALPRPVSGGSSKLEEEEDLCSRKFSLEELSLSEGEEQAEVLGMPGSEEQVEDFASSVLAAISFWHRRVVMVTVRLLPAAFHRHLCSAPPPYSPQRSKPHPLHYNALMSYTPLLLTPPK